MCVSGVVHWQSPRFFAYFSANTSVPATLADMLAGALNMIGFSWAASPVSTELEMVCPVLLFVPFYESQSSV